MTGPQLAMNILGWPLIHLGVAFATLRIPQRYFAQDSWLTVPRNWERDGRIYRRFFRVKHWKSLLPDAAPWLGGFSKKKLRRKDAQYLEQFLVETRRAEIAHWCMMAFLPVFFLWNPRWACCVMAAYATAANLPCILAQRYNRIALARTVVKACRVHADV